MARSRNDNLIRAFGITLQSARLEAAITQEQLAMLAGIDPTFVSLLERGKKQPSLSVFFAIAGALDVLPEMLMQRTLCNIDEGHRT